MVKILGFSAEYVENLTPVERKLYWTYYERDEAEKRKEQSQGSSNSITIGQRADPLGN